MKNSESWIRKTGRRKHRGGRRAWPAVLLAATACLCVSVGAQQGGGRGEGKEEEGGHTGPPLRTQPLRGPGALPPAAAIAPQQEQRAPRPFSVGESGPGGISNEPPPIPVEEIIHKFGARELEFRRERENFTYQQTFVIQTIDFDGQVDGEYRMSSDIVFSQDGKRYEKITDAPAPTLTRIQLSQQDLDDLEHIQPFVLTSEELPKYDIQYVGREQVDEIATYVFDVAPKKIEKKQRYFQGRIWVDQRDLEIVKTFGKAVPDIHTKYGENVFPRFETIRENIEGQYWFPTYTHADDTLHFTGQNVRIRMTVRYRNYKRFGVTIKFGTPTERKPPQ